MRTSASFIIGLLFFTGALSACSEPEHLPAETAPDTVQVKPDTLSGTKIAAFADQVGAVLILNYSTVGTIRGLYGTSLSVQGREIVDASSDERAYGLRISVAGGDGRYDQEHASYIDYDEIDPLLEGIDYISRIDTSITTLNNFEAHYKTRGDFQITTFSSGNEVLLSASSGTIGGERAFFNLDQLPEIKSNLGSAKSILDGIRKVSVADSVSTGSGNQ